MNAIKLYKQIESDSITISGLKGFNGKNAEIIILIDEYADSEKSMLKDQAFKIIDEHSGSLEKWSREDIYVR